MVREGHQPQGKKPRSKQSSPQGNAYRHARPSDTKKTRPTKNKLIPDEDTRWIIEKIFDLATHGNGAFSIAKRLKEEKRPHIRLAELSKKAARFANIYAKRTRRKALYVDARAGQENTDRRNVHRKQRPQQTVHRILQKQKEDTQPKGGMVSRRKTHTKQSSRKMFFCQVQKQIASRRRRQKTGDTQIFAGLIKMR